MVRNIVGSLLMIGQGERPPEWMQELIDVQDRTKAGPTASAKGLYLVKVTYPEGNNIPDYCFLPNFIL